MRKFLFVTLVAASMVPAMAMAQDGGDRGRGGYRQRGGDGAPRTFTPPASGQNSGFSDRGPRNFDRQEQPRFQQLQSEAPRYDRSQGNWNRNNGGGWDRGNNTLQATPAPAPVVQQPQQPQAQAPQRQFRNDGNWSGNGRRDWNGGDRRDWNGSGRRDWNGDNNRRGDDRWRGNDGWRNDNIRGDREGWRGTTDAQRGRDGWRGSPNWRENNVRSREYYNNGRGYFSDNRGRWNNGWRNDNRYDWRGYRTYNRNLFHLPRYYAPYGYGFGYQRFGIGVTLNSLLFSQSYWINDPEFYRLPPAYYPYRWVRYYNDAMLVDIYSGEVVDVVYDIFW